MARFDRDVVDGGVNGAGWLTRFASKISMWWDTWIVDGLVQSGGVRCEGRLVPGAVFPDRLRADPTRWSLLRDCW